MHPGLYRVCIVARILLHALTSRVIFNATARQLMSCALRLISRALSNLYWITYYTTHAARTMPRATYADPYRGRTPTYTANVLYSALSCILTTCYRMHLHRIRGQATAQELIHVRTRLLHLLALRLLLSHGLYVLIRIARTHAITPSR